MTRTLPSTSPCWWSFTQKTDLLEYICWSWSFLYMLILIQYPGSRLKVHVCGRLGGVTSDCDIDEGKCNNSSSDSDTKEICSLQVSKNHSRWCMKYHCPIEGCGRYLSGLKGVRSHLVTHKQTRNACELCPKYSLVMEEYGLDPGLCQMSNMFGEDSMRSHTKRKHCVPDWDAILKEASHSDSEIYI